MVRPALVLAGWTTLNVVLASLMWIFGENPVFIGLYYFAALPLFATAYLVHRAFARRPEPPSRIVVGQRAGMLLPLALGVGLLGVGLVYERWLCLVAVAVIALSGYGVFHRATAPPGPAHRR